MLVRFVGSDAGVGRQIEGVTYFPGDLADLPPHWARVVLAQGTAVAEKPDNERVAVPEIEHRDTFRKKKR